MADKRIPASRIREVWLDETISAEEAARRVGLTRVNLWIRAKAMGLPSRGRGGHPKVMEKAEFLALWHANVSRSEIAGHFGCSISTPYQTARRLGLPTVRPGRQITLAEYRHQRAEAALARAMAASAAETRRELKLAEMVDAPSSKFAGLA